jgi:hypothetical protein
MGLCSLSRPTMHKTLGPARNRAAYGCDFDDFDVNAALKAYLDDLQSIPVQSFVKGGVVTYMKGDILLVWVQRKGREAARLRHLQRPQILPPTRTLRPVPTEA